MIKVYEISGGICDNEMQLQKVFAPIEHQCFLRDSDIESQTRKGVQNIDTQYQI
jgi:hypothetical protein